MISYHKYFPREDLWRCGTLASNAKGYILEGTDSKTTRIEEVSRNEAEEYITLHNLTEGKAYAD